MSDLGGTDLAMMMAMTKTTTTSKINTKMSDSEILDLISSDVYAMDAGSEKGYGVNEGTGIGNLTSWLKNAVGTILTWKNKLVYEHYAPPSRKIS